MRRRITSLVLATILVSVSLPAAEREERHPKEDRARGRLAELEQRVAVLERELASLRADSSRPGGGSAVATVATEVKIFALRNADAAETAKLLTQLFGEEVRVVADARTNSVIAVGPGDDLLTVEALIARLDEADSVRTAVAEVRETLRKHAGAADLNARLEQAEAEVAKRQEQLRQTERLLEKGFVTSIQVEAERAALQAAEAVLAQVRAGLEQLSNEGSSEKQPTP
jgi:multidrug resistance efflux pump